MIELHKERIGIKAEIQEKSEGVKGEEGSKEEQQLEEVKGEKILGLGDERKKEDSIVKEKVDIEKEMQATPENNVEED